MLLDLTRPDTQVLDQVSHSEEITELWFECTEEALPGQFVFLHRSGTTYRRPFSLYRVQDKKASILYRASDPRLQWLKDQSTGTSLEWIGPLGHGFTPPKGEKTLLVGYEMGIAPLTFFAEKWGPLLKNRISAIGSFRNEANLAGVRTFLEAEIPFRLHLETTGNTLLDLVKETVESHGIERLLVSGPEGMMRMLAGFAESRRLPCEASVLRLMACESGTCLNCNLFLSDGAFTKICQSGPVFDARRVSWS